MNRPLKVQFKIGLLMVLLAYSAYAALTLAGRGTIQQLALWFGPDTTTMVPLALLIGGAVVLITGLAGKTLSAMWFALLTSPLLFYIAATCIVTYVNRTPPIAALCYTVLYWLCFDDVRERS